MPTSGGDTTLNVTFSSPNTSDGAVCGDQKMAAFIDSAMKYYSHDMGLLSKYILDQVLLFLKYASYYLFPLISSTESFIHNFSFL